MVTQATEDGGKAGDGRAHRQRRTAARRGTDGQRAAGVRQDTDLLVAPDTEAQRAQVSGGKTFIQIWCPAEDTDLPLRMAQQAAGARKTRPGWSSKQRGTMFFALSPHYRTKTGTVVIIFAVIIQTKSQNLLHYEKTYTKATLSGIKKLLFHYHRPRKKLSEECRP